LDASVRLISDTLQVSHVQEHYMTISHDGDVSFEKLEASSVVNHITAVTQSLDNQWLSQSLLVMASRAGRITERIEKEQSRQVRAEYLRTLLNAEKAVINRAYFYNNPEVFQDFTNPDSQDYRAFQSMIEEQAIIPFVLFEDSPITPPSFTRHEKGWDAWRRVAAETRLSCLRLSWDDHNNGLAVQRMTKRFHEYFQNLNQLEPGGLKRDFGLDDDSARSLSEKLITIGNLTFEQGNARSRVTREYLYNEVVVAEGTNAAERHYRWNDPLTLAAKQLIDLKYNTNLGDALQVYTLTPSDSLRRSALQEDVQLVKQGQEVDGEELIRLLQQLTFGSVNHLLRAVPVIDDLSLEDVWKVRGTRSWNTYKTTVAELLARPSLDAFLDEQHGAPAIVGAYQQMIREVERISLSRRRKTQQDRVQGVVQIAFDIGTVTINTVFLPDNSVVYELAGNLSSLVGRGIVNVAVRIGMGRLLKSRSQEKIDNTIRILELRLANPHLHTVELMQHLENLSRGNRWEAPRNGRDLSGADE
jgi:hypothetical protein